MYVKLLTKHIVSICTDVVYLKNVMGLLQYWQVITSNFMLCDLRYENNTLIYGRLASILTGH